MNVDFMNVDDDGLEESRGGGRQGDPRWHRGSKEELKDDAAKRRVAKMSRRKTGKMRFT